MIPPEVEEQFWARIDRRGPDECWLWHGHRNRAGYGIITDNGMKCPATHVALALDDKPRPEKLMALHSCDNPPCVNPAHLYWGTHNDNMRDKRERGRAAKEQIRGMRNGMNTEPSCRRPGETNPSHKITAREVLEILADTRAHASIGRDFGISGVTVWKIKNGQAWVHVTGMGSPKPAACRIWKYRSTGPVA